MCVGGQEEEEVVEVGGLGMLSFERARGGGGRSLPKRANVIIQYYLSTYNQVFGPCPEYFISGSSEPSNL